MQLRADASFREKEAVLQLRLDEAEHKLAQVQEQRADKHQEIDAQQQSTIRQFTQEKMRIRQQLREVQYQLNTDIDALGGAIEGHQYCPGPTAADLLHAGGMGHSARSPESGSASLAFRPGLVAVG
jgi:hypothetical protein